MILILNRPEAIELLGYFSLLDLSNEDRENILLDVFSENDEFEKISNFNSPEYNSNICEYLKSKIKGVTNKYLKELLHQYTNKDIDVIGEQEFLEPCPCCNYLTLESRGNYNICRVCLWEDDGSNSLERYSPANKSTLQEARAKFLALRVISKPSMYPHSDKKNALGENEKGS